ncbi:TIR domain-containing protein [Variovorax sp. OK605]|uniref:toll/interleukin-1 receptor domain-containing protein n=1 Tax=Variovorax sp. OK605 TaxID=1855317 RepID=UPI0008EAAFF2|nr:toll/interleukin-1 receptor domain-containing protein [Variovorax sp. OK605]SFO94197.1 TIR domain-containing protein [Variovorax sp. OK605]
MKVFVIGGPSISDTSPNNSTEQFQKSCQDIGKSISMADHDLVICSPFEDSADMHVLRGAITAGRGKNIRVEFHFMDSESVRTRVTAVIEELQLTAVTRIPYAPAQPDNESGRKYGWLLCQLSGLDSSHATVAIGGGTNGSANMLLLLAEGRRKPLLPFPFLGGAAQIAFERRRYELTDRLGSKNLLQLHHASCASSAMKYVDLLSNNSSLSAKPTLISPRIFISYSRERQAEADHVETLFRRRNMRVFRDETDFGAGHELPTVIHEALFSSNIFVALWSAEYACSPWCFDEFEMALNRKAQGGLELWVLRIDETRVVPVRARSIISYHTRTREELEGRIISLIEGIECADSIVKPLPNSSNF